MPPTTDNPADRAREDGNDEQWAQWEKTFRDARPVLPELAMLRIEASMQREINRVATAPPSALPRLKRRIFLLILAVSCIPVAAVWTLTHFLPGSSSNGGKGAPTVLLQDRYPLEVPIGPQLVAPVAPLIPLDDYTRWARTTSPLTITAPSAPMTQSARGLLDAAEQLCKKTHDGWHLLGLLEMRRSAGISRTMPSHVAPNENEFHLDAAWQMLPVTDHNLNQFREEVSKLGAINSNGDPAYWQTVFDLEVAHLKNDRQSIEKLKIPGIPRQFPSKTGQRARFDLLTELGVSPAQAALTVLSTRSYQPLAELQAIDRWLGKSPLHAPLYAGFLSASHELVERLFALRLAGRDQEADALAAKAMKLKYLFQPQELAVLLARLGPDDSWEQLLRPLMDDEVAFIENPPTFDQSSRRSLPVATVEGASKSVQEGVTHYTGGIKLSAGPWRITCDQLAIFRNVRHGSLLTGSGNIHVRGVTGLFVATADEVTLNTETGELQLIGHVHLDGWEQSRDLQSCTILRTGEIRP